MRTNVDYEREEITEPSDCEYAYLHTFNVRREDGWNLQMKLIKVKNRPPMSCFGDGTYSTRQNYTYTLYFSAKIDNF